MKATWDVVDDITNVHLYVVAYSSTEAKILARQESDEYDYDSHRDTARMTASIVVHPVQ